jgi:tRNA/rRNA methyltransferase
MTTHSAISLFRVVLCRPSHPGNIGAVARAMKNMGLHQLFLVNPLCDIQHTPEDRDEAYARASGAGSVLDNATYCTHIHQAIGSCVDSFGMTARRRERIIHPYPLREAVTTAYQRSQHGSIAFVFGNETHGLTTEELSACKSMAYIPANPEYASLNLAAAVQLLSYELYVQQTEIPILDYIPPEQPLAEQQQVNRLLSSLEQMLQETGFLDPVNPKQLMPRLQRFFHRANVEADEVHLLTGIIETTRKKLRQLSS